MACNLLTDLFLIFPVFHNKQHLKLRLNRIEVYIRFPRVVSIIRQVYWIKTMLFFSRSNLLNLGKIFVIFPQLDIEIRVCCIIFWSCVRTCINFTALAYYQPLIYDYSTATLRLTFLCKWKQNRRTYEKL